MKPILRNGTYYIRRRVPSRFEAVEARKEIWVSLKTDSLRLAMEKAPTVWVQYLAAWEAQLAGNSASALERHQAAKALAQSAGQGYMPIEQVSRLSTDEILERVEAAVRTVGGGNGKVLAAVLGAEGTPSLRLSEALEKYWDLTQDLRLGKSADQVRRWQNPRKKAFNNFISVVGDLPLSDVSKESFLRFRQWWIARIEDEELTTNSANKDFIHVQSVLKKVNDLLDLNLSLSFGAQKLKEIRGDERPSFSDEWISQKLLKPGALDGLNPEARAIFLVMINTGCRPSEIAGLRAEEIFLDHVVPQIQIRNNIHRQLKTESSKRDVPLVGVSLEALRAFPNGFPHYRERSNTLSGTVNKYLRENGLLETEDHVMYSLRHSFEDRMVRAHIVDRTRRELFGHSLGREKYGEGGGMFFKRQELLKIAL